VRTADVTELLQQLISIESHAEVSDRETAVGAFLLTWFEDRGIEAVLQPVEGSRANLVARIPGRGDAPGLLLNGHLDTVPGGQMRSPFLPRVENGNVWGRGACDMKGAIAAMACAMDQTARHVGEGRLAGDLWFAGTIGEETGSIGVKTLVERGVPCAYAVVGEPTSLRIGVAHKGASFLRVTISGRGAHGSRPEDGVNAISYATRLVQWLESELKERCTLRTHSLLGTSTVNVGRIIGGTHPNIVAERCVLEVDRRTVPGDTAAVEEIREGVSTLLGGVAGLDWRVEEMEETAHVPHLPLETPTQSEFVLSVQRVCRAMDLDDTPVGVPYWTDGGHLAAHGIQTVVLGPGSIANAHGPREYVPLEELRTSERLYRDLAESLLCDR
jgi:succinyl-diaminopimelate desuccinylase